LVNQGLNFQSGYCVTNLILDGWASLDPLNHNKNMCCRDWNLDSRVSNTYGMFGFSSEILICVWNCKSNKELLRLDATEVKGF